MTKVMPDGLVSVELLNLERATGERLRGTNAGLRLLIKDIQGALGTEEEGDALVEVARNAHRAELERASAYKILQDEPDNRYDPNYGFFVVKNGDMVFDYFQTEAEAQAWINNRIKEKEGK